MLQGGGEKAKQRPYDDFVSGGHVSFDSAEEVVNGGDDIIRKCP